MVASPPFSILILQVVVPLPHANFFKDVAPNKPSDVLNVHAPDVPPNVNSSVLVPSEVISFPLKVELIELKI